MSLVTSEIVTLAFSWFRKAKNRQGVDRIDSLHGNALRNRAQGIAVSFLTDNIRVRSFAPDRAEWVARRGVYRGHVARLDSNVLYFTKLPSLGNQILCDRFRARKMAGVHI